MGRVGLDGGDMVGVLHACESVSLSEGQHSLT
jgi:hypothetical protein